MSTNEDKTLALAGILQAGELVRQVAESGAWSGFAAEASLNSLFKLESNSPMDVFGGSQGVRLGLQTLISTMGGETEQVHALKYAIALLQTEKSFNRLNHMQARIGEALSDLSRQHDESETNSLNEDAIEALAELYTDTISTIEPRIVVHGKPAILQQAENVAKIRAMLFAGLRAAVLWRQVGGSRWTLLFGRKKLLGSAEALLRA